MFNFNNSYLSLPDIFYSKERPTAVRDPKLIIFNHKLAKELDLSFDKLSNEELATCFSGNKDLEGAEPIALSYAGHQFAYLAMLGDGRAILLGEHITRESQRFDIQLKGSGPTVYSRRGDGRAALAPMLREYIISEAMHALNIPTTRSLAVVSTGEQVLRTELLKGAILTRVAKSHIRVGTFEFISLKNDFEQLKELTDYTIDRHYPNLNNENDKYQKFLEAVIDRQASLIAKWLLVGFIHGVMNTDNMSIAGETIDYGPCAFMDTYNPGTVFSAIDLNGRYAYGNQANIAQWNLARFTETLLPLLSQNQEKAVTIANQSISKFGEKFKGYWLNGMGLKLGIDNINSEDIALCSELFQLMEKSKIDYTEFFVDLTYENDLGKYGDLESWLLKLQERRKHLTCSMDVSKSMMESANPIVIPRNHLVEEALLEAEKTGNLSRYMMLLEAVTNPFDFKYKGSSFSKPPAKIDSSYRTFCGT